MNMRIVSILLSLMIFTSLLAFSASAAQALPSDAPAALSFAVDYPNEGSERITANYLLPKSACEFNALTAEARVEAYGSDGSCSLEFDWSVDSESAWHIADDAKSEYGSISLDTGIDFIGNGELFWFVYDEAASRCEGAVTAKGDARVFDHDNHKLYIRARLVYTLQDDSSATEWTKAYCVNDFLSEAHEYTAPSASPQKLIVTSPVEGDDGNTYFDLSFDLSTMKAAWDIKNATGEDMSLESQIRVGDGDWKYWVMTDELYPYGFGTRAFAPEVGSEGQTVSFRCRLNYAGNQAMEIPAVSTEWSDNIVISSGGIKITENKETAPNSVAQYKCSLCHICPAPLGVCAFVWLTIVVIALFVAFIIIRAVRKGKRKNDEIREAAKQRLAQGMETDASRKAIEEAAKKRAAEQSADEINKEDK